MRLFDPLTKILPITQIELIPNGRPTIPATPHPTDPAVLDRDQPVVPLIRRCGSPRRGRIVRPLSTTQSSCPTPVRLDRLPRASGRGRADARARVYPCASRNCARLLRCGLFTDPRARPAAGPRNRSRRGRPRPRPDAVGSFRDLPTRAPRAVPPRPERTARFRRRHEPNAPCRSNSG